MALDVNNYSSVKEFADQFLPLPEFSLDLASKAQNLGNIEEGNFNDDRLQSLSKKNPTGNKKTEIINQYNPNPGQPISGVDWQVIKESLASDPYIQAELQKIRGLIQAENQTQPLGSNSNDLTRYESTASGESSCSPPSVGASDETIELINDIYGPDSGCGSGPPPPPAPPGSGNDCDDFDCNGECNGEAKVDCMGVCGGSATTDSFYNCCDDSEKDCAGTCWGSKRINWISGTTYCCETPNVECSLCPSGDGGENILICPPHPVPAGMVEEFPSDSGDSGDSGGSGGSGGSGSRGNQYIKCKDIKLPTNTNLKSKKIAINVTIDQLPELSGLYVPAGGEIFNSEITSSSKIPNVWVFAEPGKQFGLATIVLVKSSTFPCLFRWELNFRTLNGEIIDAAQYKFFDLNEDSWDRSVTLKSKAFSTSDFSEYWLKYWEVENTEENQSILDSELKETWNGYNPRGYFKEYAAPESLDSFVIQTLSESFNVTHSSVRINQVEHDYYASTGAPEATVCRVNKSGSTQVIHWDAAAATDQTSWIVKIDDDTSEEIPINACSYSLTITNPTSWIIYLIRKFNDGTTEVAASGNFQCLGNQLCPQASDNLTKKRIQYTVSCNQTFWNSTVPSVDFYLEKNRSENYIDILLTESSCRRCSCSTSGDGTNDPSSNLDEPIYFKDVKIHGYYNDALALDDLTFNDLTLNELDFTNDMSKFKYTTKLNPKTSKWELWARVKLPQVINEEFQDFIEVIEATPTETETHTTTHTETNIQSLGNLKFYAMKEDLGHLETCPAGYFQLYLKKYNSSDFIQQGTNKIFTSGSGGANMYDIPFLTLGDEGSEIAIETGDTVKLRYRPIPPSGNPYLGTSCYSFYKKPNKVSIQYGDAEDTGATDNPVITGWSKTGEFDNSTSEQFKEFEYTFSEADSGKLNWCAVMQGSPITDFKVSGGSFTSPYYNFTTQHPYGNEFSFSGTSMKIIPGLTYTFTDDGVSSSHPFTFALYNNGTKLPQDNDYISGGESEGSMHNVLKGGGKTLTVQIPENYTGEFYYICHHHSSMNIKVFGD